MTQLRSAGHLTLQYCKVFNEWNPPTEMWIYNLLHVLFQNAELGSKRFTVGGAVRPLAVVPKRQSSIAHGHDIQYFQQVWSSTTPNGQNHQGTCIAVPVNVQLHAGMLWFWDSLPSGSLCSSIKRMSSSYLGKIVVTIHLCMCKIKNSNCSIYILHVYAEEYIHLSCWTPTSLTHWKVNWPMLVTGSAYAWAQGKSAPCDPKLYSRFLPPITLHGRAAAIAMCRCVRLGWDTWGNFLTSSEGSSAQNRHRGETTQASQCIGLKTLLQLCSWSCHICTLQLVTHLVGQLQLP